MKTSFITAALLVLIAGIPLYAGATSNDNHSNFGNNQTSHRDWGSSGYGNNDHSNYGGGKSGGSFGWLAHRVSWTLPDNRYDHGYAWWSRWYGGHGGHDDDHDASACHPRH